MKLSRRSIAVLAIATVSLCLGATGVIWKAERALRSAEWNVAAAGELPVSVQVLGQEPNPGFQAVSAPAVFRSGAGFEGRFYLSGPAGLFAYSITGGLEHIYRVGLDLPAAPLGQMAVGTLADSRQPELLIASAGEGVLAFDGQRFRQIRAGDEAARTVTALLPLSSGRLLMGTAKRGLLVYDGKVLKAFHATTNNIYVTALAGDEAELWIGTLDGGLLHWRGGQAETIGEAEGLPDRRVESIALDGDAVYVGTPEGVAEIRQGKVARVLARGRYAHAVLAGSDGLFVGQMEGGVLRVSLSGAEQPNAMRRAIVAHPGANESSVGVSHPSRKDKDAARMGHPTDRPRHPAQTGPTHSGDGSAGMNGAQAEVEQILRVGDARYAVTSDRLLRLEPGGEWSGILTGGDSLLTDRNISALMVAGDGRMWIGYFDRGLDVVSAAGGKAGHVENDAVFCVNRIVENSRDGDVAVATANGLVLFDRDGRQKQVLTRESGLIANHVTDIALYGDGLVAGTPAGITFLDSTGPHSMYAFEGLVNNHVYALGARHDALVVGTLGGISLVSGGQVRRNLTTGNSGLKANWITALASAGGDSGWLAGTYGAGILRMDGDGMVVATDATTLGTVVNPGAMLADGRLVLAGTLGKGLLVGDATGTRWKTITAGLPSLNVTALAVSKGTVYVGTDNGLVEIAEDKL